MTLCTSGSLDALAPALAVVQGELTDAKKTSDNPHFRSKYADLAEVLQTVRPILSKNGLALVQTLGTVHEGKLSVTTMLLHKSGQFIQDTLQVPLAKQDAQGVGGGATYGRRYGAAAIIGLAQDDDDGETAVGRGSGAGAAKGKSKATASPPIPQDKPEALAAEFAAAADGEALKALAPRFAALPAEAQAVVLPAVKDARKRLGL